MKHVPALSVIGSVGHHVDNLIAAVGIECASGADQVRIGLDSFKRDVGAGSKFVDARGCASVRGGHIAIDECLSLRVRTRAGCVARLNPETGQLLAFGELRHESDRGIGEVYLIKTRCAACYGGPVSLSGRGVIDRTLIAGCLEVDVADERGLACGLVDGDKVAVVHNGVENTVLADEHTVGTDVGAKVLDFGHGVGGVVGRGEAIALRGGQITAISVARGGVVGDGHSRHFHHCGPSETAFVKNLPRRGVPGRVGHHVDNLIAAVGIERAAGTDQVRIGLDRLKRDVGTRDKLVDTRGGASVRGGHVTVDCRPFLRGSGCRRNHNCGQQDAPDTIKEFHNLESYVNI